MSSRIGYSTLQETLAATSLPVMNAKTFRPYQEDMVLANIKISRECMARSAEKEKEIAIEKKHIIMNVPYIIVIADGAWSKQTFGRAFYSLGGFAVVVGFETGEIIDIVLRNIPCAMCDKAERESRTPKEHNCYSNCDRTKSSGARYIIKKSRLDLPSCLLTAVDRRKTSECLTHEELTSLLLKDILNIPSHVFGEHNSCLELGWSCNRRCAPGKENLVPL